VWGVKRGGRKKKKKKKKRDLISSWEKKKGEKKRKGNHAGPTGSSGGKRKKKGLGFRPGLPSLFQPSEGGRKREKRNIRRGKKKKERNPLSSLC